MRWRDGVVVCVLGCVCVCVCWEERSKANGFMVTVIIRLAENHFVSYRAKELEGNGMKQVFSDVFRCVWLC